MSLVLNGTTGITNPGAYTGDGVSFADNTPSNTLVTTTGGNVGIGTGSPAWDVQVQKTGNSFLALTAGASSTAGVLFGDTASNAIGRLEYNNGVDAMLLFTNSAERMRITSAGNVGIGTDTPRTNFDVAVASSAAIFAGGTGNYSLRLGHNNTSASIASINAGTTFTDLNIDSLNTIFRNGSTSVAEAMRIDSSGNLLVGTTSGAAKLTVVGRGEFSSFSGAGYQLAAVSPSGGDREVFIAGVLGVSNGLTVRYVSGAMQYTLTGLANGTVSSSGGVLSASSDQNLKVADGAPSSAIEKTLALKPRYFYWKDKEGNANEEQGRQLGFFAQEVNEVLPEAAPAPKTDEEGWGVYDRSVVALLTAAIQEQQAIIEQLKADVAALKGAQA